MSYNGSGVFNINSTGQPVIPGTTITASVFNALTADLATGLSTAITKDGQTTVTNNIPFNNFRLTGIGVGTATADAARVSQVQGGTNTVITVSGTDTYTGTMSPALVTYAAGNTFSFVVPNTNTTNATLNIDGLGAKAITRDGSTALVAGDLVAGAEVVVCYDGTRFQVLNSNSKTNFNLSGNLTVAGSVTASGGTANGVAYLNGSKVLTTGSALTFDGTNLGVGTASPSYKLDVVTAGTAGARVSGTANVYTDVTDGTGNFRVQLLSNVPNIGASTNHGLNLTTNNTARVAISNAGNVTINAPSSGNALQANGSVYATGDASSVGYYLNAGGAIRTAGTGALYIDTATTTGTEIIFRPATIERMRLTPSGNLGLGVTPSGWSSKSLQVDGNIGFTVSGNFAANAYFDGSTWKYITSTAATTYQQAAGVHTWSYAASGTAGNSLTFTAAMTLDASGKLGIGVTSPTGKFEVADTNCIAYSTGTAGYGAFYARGSGTNSSYIFMGNVTSGEQGRITCINGGDLTFSNTASITERARIDSSGNLLVGTTDNAGTNTGGFELYNSAGASRLYIGHINGTANGTQYVVFNYAGTNQIGSITQSGTTAVLYNTTSDQRLKHDIVDAPSAGSLIDAIKVRSFKWNADNSEQRYGFVAQELLPVAPEAVSVPSDPDEMMGVDYSKLVPMLVKEIQELRARVAQLEAK